jgi:general secretion pathway protein C
MNQQQLLSQLSRVERPAQIVIAVALALWSAWWIADSFWLISSGPTHVVSDDRLPRVVSNASAPRSAVGAEQIRNWNVFGDPAPMQQVVAVEEAPDTRLRLELLGLFQHPESEFAGAIIAEQGRDGALFRIGDRLPGNATLDEILPDRVILLRSGQREALRLREPEVGGVSVSPQVAPQASAPRRLDRRSTPRQSVAEAQSGPDMAALQSMDPGELMAQRDMIIQQVGLSPGEGEGYRIGASAPREMLQQVGLRAGDTVVSVNGFTLGDEGNDIAALQSFRDTGAANIVIQRGAQRFTVNYPP